MSVSSSTLVSRVSQFIGRLRAYFADPCGRRAQHLSAYFLLGRDASAFETRYSQTSPLHDVSRHFTSDERRAFQRGFQSASASLK